MRQRETNPRRVVNSLVLRFVKGNVEFMSVERPRDEDQVALLLVERKVAHVQRAVSIDDGREHPEHETVR